MQQMIKHDLKRHGWLHYYLRLRWGAVQNMRNAEAGEDVAVAGVRFGPEVHMSEDAGGAQIATAAAVPTASGLAAAVAAMTRRRQSWPRHHRRDSTGKWLYRDKNITSIKPTDRAHYVTSY